MSHTLRPACKFCIPPRKSSYIKYCCCISYRATQFDRNSVMEMRRVDANLADPSLHCDENLDNGIELNDGFSGMLSNKPISPFATGISSTFAGSPLLLDQLWNSPSCFQIQKSTKSKFVRHRGPVNDPLLGLRSRGDDDATPVTCNKDAPLRSDDTTKVRFVVNICKMRYVARLRVCVK